MILLYSIYKYPMSQKKLTNEATATINIILFCLTARRLSSMASSFNNCVFRLNNAAYARLNKRS